MTLSSEEVERYARQIVLRGVGGPGQNKLKAARALVVGAGGLGSPALQYLAGAGVGTLGVVDDDEVALSNLHRQIIHGTGDIGRPKTESAAAAIQRINPHVAVEPLAVFVQAPGIMLRELRDLAGSGAAARSRRSRAAVRGGINSPFTPSKTMSIAPPQAAATIGLANAIASRKTRPNPSPVLGSAKTSAFA